MPTPPITPRPEPAQHERALGLLATTAYGRLAGSVRALPFLTVARHLVDEDGSVLLCLHGGPDGLAATLPGTVVAYGAEGPSGAERGQAVHPAWSVRMLGVCRAAEPTEEELRHLGPAPLAVDGAPYRPVGLRLAPRHASLQHWK